MAIESFYFKHDYSSRGDKKLQRVLQKEGIAGVGIYWCVLEMIYEEGGYLQLDDCESIAFALRTKQEIVKRVVINYELFRNDGTKFWSESALRRLKARETKSSVNSKVAKEGWKKRKVDANALPTHNERNAPDMQGEERRREEKRGEEKERIEEDRILDLGEGKIFVTVDTPYVHEQKLRVYDLEKFFEHTNQIDQIKLSNWLARGPDFLKEFPGKNFDDKNHLYNAFKNYCTDARRTDQKTVNGVKQFSGTGYGSL